MNSQSFAGLALQASIHAGGQRALARQIMRDASSVSRWMKGKECVPRCVVMALQSVLAGPERVCAASRDISACGKLETRESTIGDLESALGHYDAANCRGAQARRAIVRACLVDFTPKTLVRAVMHDGTKASWLRLKAGDLTPDQLARLVSIGRDVLPRMRDALQAPPIDPWVRPSDAREGMV